MSLRDLTYEEHRDAERQAFVSELMSGNMPPEKYATFLYNQYKIYQALEQIAVGLGVFENLDGATRMESIHKDWCELADEHNPPEPLQTTKDYIRYLLDTVQFDKKKCIAHVYVRHLGDMSGGQMLQAKVPGLGRMYNFASPRFTLDELKNNLRDKTDDSMADEARLVFKYAINLYRELNGEPLIQI